VKILHFLGIGRLPKQPMVEASGGTERVALEVARIQSGRGHDVTVASKGEDDWEGAWEGVRLLHLKPYAWARAVSLGKIAGSSLPLAKLVHLRRFDIVHLHEYPNTRLLGSYAKVMHFHNEPLGGSTASEFAEAAPAYWALVGRSSAQVAVSEFVAGRLRSARELAGADSPPANIFKVSNGVNSKGIRARLLNDIRRSTRQKLALTDTDVLFLFVGAIRPEKGVDYLARAFARLSAENPNACLAVAGGGKLWIEKGWLNDKAVDTAERQLVNILSPAIERKRAFILGIVPPSEIMAYYAAGDVLVVPTMAQEAFGLTILEAFTMGLPVVAFRSGGVPELVEDRKNGIIVDQGDEEALYLGMRELMRDRDLRTRLGAAAANVPAQYSWENTANGLDLVYRSVIERQNSLS
jgi:glycosyltransferase involved in cell wall biosynthesis